jgi:hypothetical protein
VANCDTKTFEVIFDSFIHLNIPELLRETTKLFLFLIKNDHTAFRPLLDKYLSSKLPTGQIFGIQILLSLKIFDADDGQKIIKFLKDADHSVVSSTGGGLYVIFEKNVMPLKKLKEEIKELRSGQLEVGIFPIFTNSSWRILFRQIFSFKWYGFYKWIIPELKLINASNQRRNQSSQNKAIDRLLQTMKRYTLIIASLQIFMATATLLFYKAGIILFYPQTTKPISGSETVLLEALPTLAIVCVLLFLLNRLIPFALSAVLSFSTVKLKYRTLKPAPLLLEELEKGRATVLIARDLAAEAGNDEQIKRRIIRLAMEKNTPMAAETMKLMIANDTIGYDTLRTLTLICKDKTEELEQLIDLLGPLTDTRDGEILVNRLVNDLWSYYVDCSNLDTLLNFNVSLTPPLLLRARKKLSSSPLTEFQLLLQVIVEAPHTYPVYRMAVIEGVGFSLVEDCVVPAVYQHIIRLYPQDMFKALKRAYRYKNRDKERREEFVKNLFNRPSSEIITTIGLFQPIQSRETSLRLKAAIVEQAINESKEESLQILSSLAKNGIEPPFFEVLREIVHDRDLSNIIRSIQELMECNDSNIYEILELTSTILSKSQFSEVKQLGEELEVFHKLLNCDSFTSIYKFVNNIKDTFHFTSQMSSGLKPFSSDIRQIIHNIGAIEACSDEFETSALKLMTHGTILKISEKFSSKATEPFGKLIVALGGKFRLFFTEEQSPAKMTRTTQGNERHLKSVQEKLDNHFSIKDFFSRRSCDEPGIVGLYIRSAVAPINLRANNVFKTTVLQGTDNAPVKSLIESLSILIKDLETYEWVRFSSLWYQTSGKEKLMSESYIKAASLLSEIYSRSQESHQIIELTISLSFIGAPRLRKILLSIGGKALSEAENLQREYLTRIIKLSAESRNLPMLLSPLHNSLFTGDLEEASKSDLAIFNESSNLFTSPHLATEETLRCFGRASIVSPLIKKQLSSLKNTMTLYQKTIIESEILSCCPDRDPLTVLNLLEEAGRTFLSDSAVFKNLSAMRTRERKNYLIWIELVMETTQAISVKTARNSNGAAKILKTFQNSTNLLISYGATLQLGLLLPEETMKNIPAIFLTEINGEAQKLFAGAILNSENKQATEILEKFPPFSKWSDKEIILLMSEFSIPTVTGAVWLENHFDSLVEYAKNHRPLYNFARLCFQLLSSKELDGILQSLILTCPEAFHHETMEEFWQDGTKSYPERVRELVELIPSLKRTGNEVNSMEPEEILSTHHSSSDRRFLALVHLTKSIATYSKPENASDKMTYQDPAKIIEKLFTRNLLREKEVELLGFELTRLLPDHEELSPLLLKYMRPETNMLKIAPAARVLAYSILQSEISWQLLWSDPEQVESVYLTSPDPVSRLIAAVLRYLNNRTNTSIETSLITIKNLWDQIDLVTSYRTVHITEKEQRTRKSLKALTNFISSIVNKQRPSMDLLDDFHDESGIKWFVLSISIIYKLLERCQEDIEKEIKLTCLCNAEQIAQDLSLKGMSLLPATIHSLALWLRQETRTSINVEWQNYGLSGLDKWPHQSNINGLKDTKNNEKSKIIQFPGNRA